MIAFLFCFGHDYSERGKKTCQNFKYLQTHVVTSAQPSVRNTELNTAA